MNALTVSQVNKYIKAMFDEIPHIHNIYIRGEISNFKHYSSGHMYFTLKDASSQLKSVMFAGDNYKLKFEPENGMNVICFGQVGVYERDGVYQLYVRDMQVDGIGDLQVAFEQLKEKLDKEGLFSPENKKPIPEYPRKIGVATSNMGAAVEDIKNIITRRYPLCEIVIVPTVVQGDAAAPDIVKSIQMLDSLGDIDTIIVGRGGGSIEDLWAFNTEEVARAVYACKTPIISAVGHETDTTICDFVADMRAPTPSAAAERAVPDIINEKEKISNISSILSANISHFVENEELRLDFIMNKSALSNKDNFFKALTENIQSTQDKLGRAYKSIIDKRSDELAGAARALNALSPLAVLSRGYSITKSGDEVISDVDGVSVGDKISVFLTNGSISAEVYDITKKGE